MRKSCHEHNHKMLQAYNLYRSGSLAQSFRTYEQILDHTSNPELRQNLITTLSVISTALGNYNYALQLLQFKGNMGGEHVPSLIQIRHYANLCFLHIVMGLYEEAVDDFRTIKDVVIGVDDHQLTEVLEFLFMVFFRVSSVDQLRKPVQISDKASLIQAYYMLNLAFGKDICNAEGSQELLKAAYTIFVNHNKMQLAVVSLRQLLLQPLTNKEIIKYEKQLSKIMSMDLMDNYELENMESMQCCKTIAQDLVEFSKQLNLSHKESQKGKAINQAMWLIVLNYQSKKLLNNSLVAEEERQAINKNIEMMLKEENPLIIWEMQKTDFYITAERQIKNILFCFTRTCEGIASAQMKTFFQKLMSYGLQKTNQKTLTRNRSHTQLENRTRQKQNRMPLTLVREKSCKSFVEEQKKMTRIEAKAQLQQCPKHIYKMLKFCQYGSFLSKRNFSSDGGQYRFVRMTQSVLKWAKNPDKIEQSCQLYPLKDIKSIIYGKCTPTLLKQSNHLLKQEYCFSLRLQKRTLDFYCKDFEQVSNWVCGLTIKLKQINPNIKGYTYGRMLWKRMFMIMKQNFTSKIKVHERKFYYETAQAVTMFGKNNYQLPMAK